MPSCCFSGLASYGFYALSGWTLALLLLALSLVTLLLAQRRSLIWLAVLANLGVLIFFKYWDFGLSAIPSLNALRLVIPLGVSFYVFKHIGYLLDVRNGRTTATRDALAFVTFSAFLPQISAGPISSFQDTGTQLANLPTNLAADQARRGAIHLSVGLAKKLLIADTLGISLTAITGSGELAHGGLLLSWFTVVLFALQLYFDFSGYSDIALGLGYLFGVRLPPNFNNPYLARTPSEFWQRWHISLSQWVRSYLFMPLSRFLLRRLGMARSRLAQYISNFVTMAVMGLWHGATAPFLLWGLWHGLLLNIYATIGITVRVPRVLLLVGVLIGWALFMSPDLAFAGALLGGMAGVNGIGTAVFLRLFDPFLLTVMLLAAFIAFSGFSEGEDIQAVRFPLYAFLLGCLLILSLLHLGDVKPFAYVQF
ncbi:MAG: MBOAT family O-acyltransferase [Anaerolineae bacterium]